MHHIKKSSANRESGFAVIIALTMMSFVLVLMLSLTTLTQVELSHSKRSNDQLLARENARLGVLVAIGNIQKLTGPDERVTVRGDAFESSSLAVQHPQWIGVMDTTNPSANPADIDWLISMPTNKVVELGNPLADEKEVLVSERSSTTQAITVPEVVVPLIQIGEEQKFFGYWVSDESQKASLTTRPLIDDQADDWLDSSYGKANASRLDQIIPKRTGLEMLFDPQGSDDDAILKELVKTYSVEQLRLSQSWDIDDYQYLYHDITSRSFGVIASTTGTGLKDDYSLRPDLFPIPSNFERIYDFESYMETPLPAYEPNTPYIPHEDDLRRRYEIKAPTSVTDLELSDGIYPIITEFKLLMHVHVAGSNVVNRTTGSIQPILDNNEIVIRTQFHLELWNPYTSALVPENLVLEINGLPTVTVELEDIDEDNNSTVVVDLDALLKNGTSTTEGFFVELPFTDRGFSNHDDFSWLPGRLYNWVGPNNYSNGSPKNTKEAVFYQRSLGNGIWYTGTGTTTPTTTRSIGLSAPAINDLTVTLRTKGSSGNLDSGAVLTSVENIEFNGFSTGGGINKTSSGPRFGFHIQRDESGFVGLSSDPWEKSRWLRVEDPREPNPTFDSSGNGVGGFQAPNGLDPTAYTSTAISNSQFLFDRTAGLSGFRPSEDIPLFELLRQRPISLGELQHLMIVNERPFTIGNSWGGEGTKRYNRIFDEGYFSGLNSNDTEPNLATGELPPNHRLRLPSERTVANPTNLNDVLASREDSSQYFLTEGSFNLNSTSSKAWAAILGSMYFEDWEVANIDDQNGDVISSSPIREVPVGQAILRFPQSAQEVFHTGDYRSNSEPPTEFFRVGAKYFEDASGDNDIAPYSDLGTAIADRVVERISQLGPFASIEEFLAPVGIATFKDPKDATRNLSVIERAILDVAELNTSDLGDIWYHSSNFLSQADVMTGIAPIATVRGDTFVIRSVGVSGSEFSISDKNKVYCEAIVQRLPETLDPADSILTPNPNGFGRRYIIKSIRWMDPSEL